MLKRGKKGDVNEHILFLILDIVIVVIVWAALLNHVKSIRKNTLFDKIYLSRDLALLINTLYSSPGNLFYVYSSDKINLSDFMFSFRDNYVGVKEGYNGNELSFPYAHDMSIEADFLDIKSKRNIEFTKADNKVHTGIYNLNQLSCPDIDTKADTKIIIIDPGHGDDPDKPSEPREPGLEFGNKKESSITMQIANLLAKPYDFIKLTRNYEHYLTIQKRRELIKKENADIIISIHIGNYSNDYNTVKAFVPYRTGGYLESKKLACHILNAFSSKFDLGGIVIIPIDTLALTEEDPMQIINSNETSVFLEIGNINTEEGREMFKDLSKISQSIYTGLTEYAQK